MKRVKIEISEGIKTSFKILEILKKDDRLRGYTIMVGAFTNCREVGLTFYFLAPKQIINRTFCVYEDRHTDNIIINSKEGCIGRNGDLPYGKEIGDFGYHGFSKAANALVEEILKLSN